MYFYQVSDSNGVSQSLADTWLEVGIQFAIEIVVDLVVFAWERYHGGLVLEAWQHRYNYFLLTLAFQMYVFACFFMFRFHLFVKVVKGLTTVY